VDQFNANDNSAPIAKKMVRQDRDLYIIYRAIVNKKTSTAYEQIVCSWH